MTGTAISSNSNTSDIISAGGETFNIDYAANQAATINATGDAVRVGSFRVRDGGGAVDADSVGTILTAITFGQGGSNTVTNWGNTIRQAALFNGSTKVAEVSVTGNTISFSGLSGANVTAPDGGSITLDLYITFETSATDNQQFQFVITSASADGINGSTFAAANASGATTSTTGDSNRVEVTATALSFVQQPTNVNVNQAMSPAVTVEAVDANNNRDLDYVTNVSITSAGATLSGSPVTTAAVAGLATFSGLTFTTTGMGVTLEATSGSLTNVTSNSFNVVIPSQVIISEIYGGGGNSGAAFRNDFVELRNTGSTAVDISGYSIQYASATGNTWQVFTFPMGATIQPNGYYLVALASGGAVGTELNTPTTTPDATGTIDLSATNGKVALVTNQTPLSGVCPTGAAIADFVGYGTANCFEGSGAAPAGSNTTSVRRASFVDTNVNSNDFITANPPTPQNSAAPTAANVTISGRVTDSAGYGIRNANVTLTGGGLTEAITIETNDFGYYLFGEIPAGETYIVTVRARRYTFAQPSRVISLGDNVADADFVADKN